MNHIIRPLFKAARYIKTI